MKLKETRILDAEGARYACIANDYCTRCDCETYSAMDPANFDITLAKIKKV